MGRAVILANGEPETVAFVRSVVRPDDLLLAADGGARMALAAGLHPREVVGDLDSLAEDEIAALAAHSRVIRHPVEKAASDLELALDRALEAGADEVVILGALGGRVDHLLVNVGLLQRSRLRGVPARLLSAAGEVRLVDGEAVLERPVGSLVSLIPTTPRVEGVTLAGLRYPLRGETLEWGSSRGLSNVVVASPVTIRVASGILLVFAGLDGGRGEG